MRRIEKVEGDGKEEYGAADTSPKNKD